MGAYGAAAISAGAALATGLYVTAADTIDRQSKLARALNSTTSSVQSLEYAADLAGIAHEQLSAASGKLNARLGQAITVGGAAAKELDRLGLSAKDLASMGADERMATIADRIVELKYNSAQAAASLKELGLKGNEMVAMMMDGGQQFRDANRELRELNVLVSDVDASKIEASNDAWTKVRMVLKGVANTLAVELSPYVQVVADYLREASIESGGFKKQIGEAIKTGLVGFGHVADVVQGLRVVFKGVQVVVVGFGAAAASVIEVVASSIANLMDGFVLGANLAIAAQNKLTGSATEFLSLPSESAFMKGIHDLAESARDKVGELRGEFADLAEQQMPGDRVAQFLEDVKNKANEAAQAVVDSRKRMFEMPEENEEAKKKKDRSDNVVDGLRAGTQGMLFELAKRKEILAIYRENTLAADAPYYAQQLNDILINEQLKQAEILSSAQKEKALRMEQRAQNLERVAEDKIAMAAVIAEYDTQEKIAEINKQDELTQIQEDAQQAREKLRYAERQNAISVALSLGQQLMSLVQGHSKRAFEFAKATAIGSALIDGYRSAVSAWRAGMGVGGPPVAAAFTAASLLKTGAMIQDIRSASFGSGSSSGGGGSGSGDSAAASGTPAVQPAAGPAQTMHVQGLNPSDLFTGSALQTIAQGLLNFQKDGGQVVWNA